MPPARFDRKPRHDASSTSCAPPSIGNLGHIRPMAPFQLDGEAFHQWPIGEFSTLTSMSGLAASKRSITSAITAQPKPTSWQARESRPQGHRGESHGRAERPRPSTACAAFPIERPPGSWRASHIRPYARNNWSYQIFDDPRVVESLVRGPAARAVLTLAERCVWSDQRRAPEVLTRRSVTGGAFGHAEICGRGYRSRAHFRPYQGTDRGGLRLRGLLSGDHRAGVLKALESDYPNAPKLDRDAIFADASIDIICIAAIPADRAGLAVRAMKAGKDVMTDKPGVTTFAQLEEVRRTVEETGKSSRSASPNATACALP